tara:strand:- start:105 stop:344 length:240 start_codon:yes stop_codon:yes gene_type:complete
MYSILLKRNEDKADPIKIGEKASYDENFQSNESIFEILQFVFGLEKDMIEPEAVYMDSAVNDDDIPNTNFLLDLSIDKL